MPVDRVRVATAWFPAGDYERALVLWPDLLEEWSGVEHGIEHQEYCRRIETKLRELAAAGIPLRGVAPLELDRYLDWCAGAELDPSEAGTRAHYAAQLELQNETIPWPPGRNDPCWCGSNEKYKRCCRARRATEA